MFTFFNMMRVFGVLFVVGGEAVATYGALDDGDGVRPSINGGYERFPIHPDDLAERIVCLEGHVRAKANPPVGGSDFILPLATGLMFTGSAFDKFDILPEAANWCFFLGSGIFVLYACAPLGKKIYRKCCGIRQDPLLPL